MRWQLESLRQRAASVLKPYAFISVGDCLRSLIEAAAFAAITPMTCADFASSGRRRRQGLPWTRSGSCCHLMQPMTAPKRTQWLRHGSLRSIRKLQNCRRQNQLWLDSLTNVRLAQMVHVPSYSHFHLHDAPIKTLSQSLVATTSFPNRARWSATARCGATAYVDTIPKKGPEIGTIRSVRRHPNFVRLFNEKMRKRHSRAASIHHKPKINLHSSCTGPAQVKNGLFFPIKSVTYWSPIKWSGR